jgi:hypothetical protein
LQGLGVIARGSRVVVGASRRVSRVCAVERAPQIHCLRTIQRARMCVGVQVCLEMDVCTRVGGWFGRRDIYSSLK